MSTHAQTHSRMRTRTHFPHSRDGGWPLHQDTSLNLNGTKSTSASQKQPCVLRSQAAYSDLQLKVSTTVSFLARQEVAEVEAATSCELVAQKLGRATGLEQELTVSRAAQALSQGKLQKYIINPLKNGWNF